jgi:hypothetical protein
VDDGVCLDEGVFVSDDVFPVEDGVCCVEVESSVFDESRRSDRLVLKCCGPPDATQRNHNNTIMPITINTSTSIPPCVREEIH